MADNAVFVKIFRDHGEFEHKRKSLDACQLQFEGEKKYREELAKATGVPPEAVTYTFNHHLDPKIFYPAFDCDSCEYRLWIGLSKNDMEEKGAKEVTFAEFTNLAKIPTEVLEEQKFVSDYCFFNKIHYWWHKGKCAYVLIGERQRERYLIAYWGDKKNYDDIQTELREEELARQREKELREKELIDFMAKPQKELPEPKVPATLRNIKSDFWVDFFIWGMLMLAASLGFFMIINDPKEMPKASVTYPQAHVEKLQKDSDFSINPAELLKLKETKKKEKSNDKPWY